MARISNCMTMLTAIFIAIVLSGCSQAGMDYAIVRAGLTPHDQMTPPQRKLELERLQVGCVGYVYDSRAKAAGESRGTIDECLEKVGYNKLSKFDRDRSAKSAPAMSNRGN